jgi:23S rRNA pseudouridine1911/1915/1917 synthase
MRERNPKRRRSPNQNRREQRSQLQEVRLLYEDDAVVALDKPAGLPAVPVAKNASTPSAWSLLKDEMKRRRAIYKGQRKQLATGVFVVHRIDRFTSGVLLFAKSERDRDQLVQQFLAHTPVREYLAVVRGQLKENQGTLMHYFRKERQYQALSSPKDKKAARAELQYRVEERLKDACLLRVKLITGLQNQIRVQFSAIQHSVIGDRKYHASEAEEKRIDRVALHAARLQFTHPRTAKITTITSEIPSDMQRLIRGLRLRPEK